MALEEIRQVSSHRQWPHARGRHRTPTPMGPPPVHTHERWHVRRHPRPWFHTALNKLAKAAWDPNTPQIERYWTGQLTASQLANAFGCNISTPLPEYQFHKLEQSVTKILLPLYNGGMNMLKNRGCRHHNIKVTPLTQPSTPTTSQALTLPPTRQSFNSSKQHPPLEPSPPRELDHNAGLQIRPGYKRLSPTNETQTRLELPDPLSPTHTPESKPHPPHPGPQVAPDGRDITQRKTTGLSPTQGMVAPRCLQQCTSSPEKTQYLATLMHEIA